MIRRRSTIEPVAGPWDGAAFPGAERRRARKAACRSCHTFSHIDRQCARIHIDGAGPFCLPAMASDWVTHARASQPTTDLSNLFNGTFRDEGLNTYRLLPLDDAAEKIESCRCDCNHFQPRSSLENNSSAPFVDSTTLGRYKLGRKTVREYARLLRNQFHSKMARD